jgi:hypothetical protein
MGTEEHVGNIMVRLSDLRYDMETLLLDSQEELRGYVTNKSFPLEDRFEIWAQWCVKIHHDFRINASDVPLFGAVVDEDVESTEFGCTPDRYCVYGWEHFLESFEEDPDRCDRFKVTVGDVKEMLIETNFKGYTHDW